MKRTINLLLGPVLWILVAQLTQGVFEGAAAYALGTAVWMIFWWVTRPVHIAITAIVPLIANALVPMAGAPAVAANYANDTVVLLFGANLLTLPWATTGLDKRLALKSLTLVGTSVKRQIFVWFLVATVLTSVLPNFAVCIMLVPIAIAMLKNAGHADVANSDVAPLILMATAWGSCVGGCISPLGGAMNLTAIKAIEEFTGQEFMYIDWTLRLLPFAIVVFLVVLAMMLILPIKTKKLEGTKEFFKESYAKLGKMKTGEKICAFLFVLALVLAFLRPFYAKYLKGLTPTYVFLILGASFFFIPGEDKKPMVTWQQAEKGMAWNMLILFAGGMALGTLLSATGATKIMAGLISGMSLTGGFATMAVFVLFTSLLSETTSQTAAAAIVTPIIIATTTSLNLNPAPYLLTAAMAFNNSFILPLGVRAVPVSYGMSPTTLLKRGLPIAIVNNIVMIVVGFLFMQLWPFFGNLPGIV